MLYNWFRVSVVIISAIVSTGCKEGTWNNPYPGEDATANILYTSFSGRPKHLDPAQSYSSNEIAFTGQIYEPPLQYHFLKRPYEIIPLAAASIPRAIYYNKNGEVLPDNAPIKDIAYTKAQITNARKKCDELVTKLCKDLGSETESCQMVKKQAGNFPPEKAIINQAPEFIQGDTRWLTRLRQP